RPLSMEMCLLGRPVMAMRFAELGAVNRICANGKALDEALMLADTLAAGPRAAQGAIRQLVAQAYEAEEADQLDAERNAMAHAAGGDEAAEGIAAFLEKRKARF
ncbi:MAG: enoyl-CoA hydratase, partial [Oceanibulbus sp.]|nr:enoyl-CoA hydratase [Sulfitobacter sp.]